MDPYTVLEVLTILMRCIRGGRPDALPLFAVISLALRDFLRERMQGLARPAPLPAAEPTIIRMPVQDMPSGRPPRPKRKSTLEALAKRKRPRKPVFVCRSPV
jgi:hypothetical protein